MYDNVKYYLLIDLWQYILEYLQVEQTYTIIQSDKEFINKIYIYDLSQECDFVNNLTDHILNKRCFDKLTKLNAYNNSYITSVNHLTRLEYLDASYNCKIDNDSISKLTRIKILDISGNKITNLGHMKKLEELHVSYYNNIDDKVFKTLPNLKIIWLYMYKRGIARNCIKNIILRNNKN